MAVRAGRAVGAAAPGEVEAEEPRAVGRALRRAAVEVRHAPRHRTLPVARRDVAETREAAGVLVAWEQADVTVDPPKPEAYDLVSAFYPALRHTPDEAAISALIDAVAPGGTLLVVGHDVDSMKHHHVGFDPDDYVQPPDIAERLGDGWTIETLELRPRVRPPGHDGPDIPDRILRARRSA